MVEHQQKEPLLFFAQNQSQLANALKGMTVGVWGTDRKFTVTEATPWSRAEDEKRPLYGQVLQSQPGTVVLYPRAMMGNHLTLVVAQDEATEESGACVQLKRADPGEGDVPATGKRRGGGQDMTQTDIAEALGITPEDTGPIHGTLQFMDDSDVLYFQRTPKEAAAVDNTPKEITSAEAAAVMGNVFGFEE